MRRSPILFKILGELSNALKVRQDVLFIFRMKIMKLITEMQLTTLEYFKNQPEESMLGENAVNTMRMAIASKSIFVMATLEPIQTIIA